MSGESSKPAVEHPPPAFQFGPFELSPHTRELRKFGVKLKLQDQPLQILLMLLENPGELVTREGIQRRLWPENTYVDFDNSINSAVRKLRDALGDSADNPRFIETMSRRGYRFIAPLKRGAAVPLVRDRAPEETESRRLPFPRQQWLVLAIAPLVAIVAGSLFWYSERSSPASGALPAPVPLTSYPGFQWAPSFSPDGTRTAFTWDEPGQRSSGIYIKLIGPTQPIRLTFAQGDAFAPAWSPDGRWIAFLQTTGPFNSSVTLIPSLGGPTRELTRVQMNASNFIHHLWWAATPPFLAWSSDGKWLLALEQAGQDPPTPQTPVRIVRISVESGEKSPFTLSLNADQDRHQGRPSSGSGEEGLVVSPDGKTLAFIHAMGDLNKDPFVVPLSHDMRPAGPARSLHFDNTVCQGIAWDKDGRSLIVSSNRRGSRELWRVPVSRSGEPSLIPVSDESPSNLAISSTGQRLVYTHSVHDMSIWRVNLTSSGLTDIAPFITSTRDEIHPSYSGDGKRIAFESDRFGNEEIWASDADGSNAVQVSSLGKAYAGSPRWSPDTRQIAFDSNSAGEWNVYLIPSQGGRPTLFTLGSGSKVRPSWSHDGKWIYYCASEERGTQIWKKAVVGERQVQVTKHGGCNPVESLDGSYLYYLRNGNSVLCRVPVDGGEEVQLAQLGTEAQFALGKSGVYFLASMTANELKLMDYRTGFTKTLGSLPGHSIHGLAVSPDEHWLLYAKDESAGSHLMLLENFR